MYLMVNWTVFTGYSAVLVMQAGIQSLKHIFTLVASGQ